MVTFDWDTYTPYMLGFENDIKRITRLEALAGGGTNYPPYNIVSGSDNTTTLEVALAAVREFSPKAVVIALGLDAAKDDPLGAFNITTSGFQRITERIMELALPTVLIQEGGYLCDALPRNLEAVLQVAGASFKRN